MAQFKTLNIVHSLFSLAHPLTWITKFSAPIYGGIYLLLIPLFAFIYSYFPDEFYQSNAQYDESYLREINAFAQKLENDLNGPDIYLSKPVEIFGDWPHREFALRTNYGEGESASYYIQRFEIVDFFRGQYHWDRNKLIIRPLSQGFPYWHKVQTFDKNRIPNDLFEKYSDELWLMPVFGKTEEKLHYLDKYAEGRGAMDIPRLIYFSTVTITTLGYGDIVPTSNRVRLLVAFESIMGIVLAGLFINSAARRKGEQSTHG